MAKPLYTKETAFGPSGLKLGELRDELIRSRLSGVLSVTDQNGEKITYKSDTEMAAAIEAIEATIREITCSRPASTIHFSTSKGL